MTIGDQEIQKKLKRELQRLKRKLGLLGYLQVVWQPQELSEELGCVKGNTIFIYARGEDEALQTLRHEVVEHLLTEHFLLPRLFESKCHRQSDRCVDLIVKLIKF